MAGPAGSKRFLTMLAGSVQAQSSAQDHASAAESTQAMQKVLAAEMSEVGPQPTSEHNSTWPTVEEPQSTTVDGESP